MKRYLVNDCKSALPGGRTFWHDLEEWFGLEFVGAPYGQLAAVADKVVGDASLIIRNGSWFGPLEASKTVPTISLIQDIFDDGPLKKMQSSVKLSSWLNVYNSEFTKHKVSGEYDVLTSHHDTVIPLPVDFRIFEPQNAMGLQQLNSLPDHCICWIGACQGPAGHIKGWDDFLKIVRINPDLSFVAVFKDKKPEYAPPNMRMYEQLSHEELVKVIGACRVGLCTSRMESQHLAGIEMGGCGLPMIAPPVGVYWQRDDMPGAVVAEPGVPAYTSAIRAVLAQPGDPQQIHEYWLKEFSHTIVRNAWSQAIQEVEDGTDGRDEEDGAQDPESVADDAEDSGDHAGGAAEGHAQEEA